MNKAGHLPVLRPFRLAALPSGASLPLTPRHGALLVFALAIGFGEAQAGPGEPSILATMVKWTPLLAQGFALNIAMSFLAMAMGTVLGLALGLGLISLARPVRAFSWLSSFAMRRGWCCCSTASC